MTTLSFCVVWLSVVALIIGRFDWPIEPGRFDPSVENFQGGAIAKKIAILAILIAIADCNRRLQSRLLALATGDFSNRDCNRRSLKKWGGRNVTVFAICGVKRRDLGRLQSRLLKNLLATA
jgi:hypothetical protein